MIWRASQCGILIEAARTAQLRAIAKGVRGMFSEICDLPAVQLAAMIAERSLSPVELMRASLARIGAVQPRLNPFCFVYEDAALHEAARAEDAVMRGETLGPLHGLPIAIKDFTPTKGLTTTRGSAAFADWVPDEDALIVRRLCTAGAIVIGKTTTPEFAFSSFTRSPLWGDTLNPWDSARSSGGSSGGSAVAVATGCVALAEGTDMGGSVRIPAALCGIVGLKPSLGRIPMDILPTCFDLISHFGPLARSVADAALFLSVTEGPDESDILSQVSPRPVGEFGQGVAGLRIGVSADLGYYEVAPDVAANLRRVADALRDAGAVVEEVDLGWTIEVFHTHSALWQVYLAAAFGHLLPQWRERLDPDVVAIMEAGQRLDAVTYRRLDEARTRHWHRLARILLHHDAMICPTMARTAPLASAHDADFEHIDAHGRLHGLDMTGAFNNVAQVPALAVPSGFGADGLPTSVQIVGRRFDDGMVLRIGAAIERAMPWPLPR